MVQLVQRKRHTETNNSKNDSDWWQ